MDAQPSLLAFPDTQIRRAQCTARRVGTRGDARECRSSSTHRTASRQADHTRQRVKTATWKMTAAGREAVKRGRNARRGEEGDDEDDDGNEPMGPISPSARRGARRGRP